MWARLRTATVIYDYEESISAFVSAPYVPSSHYRSRSIPPSLHLFTKARVLQFSCMTRRRSHEVHRACTLANAPTLSDCFGPDCARSMRYESSHEIRSNSKMRCFTISELAGGKKLSLELVLAVCCFLWRGPGCEGLGGTCELSELRGWANFKGPYIMSPLADSSALFCKWQCLSVSRSHAHHPLFIQASLSISFLICTPSLYLGLSAVILPVLKSPFSLFLSLDCFMPTFFLSL